MNFNNDATSPTRNHSLNQPKFTTKRRYVTGAVIGILSLAGALGGTDITARLAEHLDWCCVNGWALIHGTFIVVLMAWGLVAFHLVSAVAGRLNLLLYTDRFGLIPHLTYASAALSTWWLSGPQYTGYFLWPGLIFGITAVIMRRRGQQVSPFGIAVIGFLVSVAGLLYWLYFNWLSWVTRD